MAKGEPAPAEPRHRDGMIGEEDALRGRFYGLLARLLTEPVSAETLAIVRALEGDATDMGRALQALATVARRTTVEAALDEFSLLFYGNGAGGELLPYASFYLTGFVYEKPLAALRADMERLGIAHSGARGEPEDHIAFLCEMMHGLVLGRFGGRVPLADQRAFFDAHLGRWAGRFFEDLEAANSAAFYMPVGTIGRLFMAIEAEGFAMAA